VFKAFRRELGSTSYSTLSTYAGELLKFIRDHDQMFPTEARKRVVEERSGLMMLSLREEILEQVESRLDAGNTLNERAVKLLVTDVVTPFHDRWNGAERCANVTEDLEDEFGGRNEELFDRVIEQTLQDIPLSRRTRQKVIDLCVWVNTRYGEEFHHLFESGFVVAGFGAEEFFPAMEAFRVTGVPDHSFLHWREDERTSRWRDAPGDSGIVPFAQKEMVQNFMDGIDPSFANEVFKALHGLLRQMPDMVDESLDSVQLSESDGEKLRDAGEQAVRKFADAVRQYQKQEFVDPVLEVVKILPKDELAAMARSFVNLTSFKRRVSQQLETVGGPVDVAVISKGDGFIWIDRKQYFDPELNPRYLRRLLQTPEST
jgi:hypothetical protein